MCSLRMQPKLVPAWAIYSQQSRGHGTVTSSMHAAYCCGAIKRPQDRWIDVLCRLPGETESWTARVFILWGRHILPDIIAELWDGDAESYLDEEYAELVINFDEYQQENRLQQLDRMIQPAAARPSCTPLACEAATGECQAPLTASE